MGIDHVLMNIFSLEGEYEIYPLGQNFLLVDFYFTEYSSRRVRKSTNKKILPYALMDSSY